MLYKDTYTVGCEFMLEGQHGARREWEHLFSHEDTKWKSDQTISAFKLEIKLALLCATAQQSYYHDAASVVFRHRFLGYHWMHQCQILGTGTYPPYLQTIFVFVFSKFYFFTIFPLFVNMGLYGRKHFKWHIYESTHQVHSQKSCILLRRVRTKVIQTIVKFQVF